MLIEQYILLLSLNEIVMFEDWSITTIIYHKLNIIPFKT